MVMHYVESAMDDCENSGAVNGTNPAPWPPSKATSMIRQYARGKFDISYKRHAVERMDERGLIKSDVLHVLKNGFVYAEATPAKTMGYFRYAIEGSSPNSGGRTLRIIVIPSLRRAEIKVVTIMWVDETE